MLAAGAPLLLRQALLGHSLSPALCVLSRCNILTSSNGKCAFSTTAARREEQQPQGAAPLPPASGPLVGIKASWFPEKCLWL